MPRKIRGPFVYLDDAGTTEFADVMKGAVDDEFTDAIITTENHEEKEPADDNMCSAAYILSIVLDLWDRISRLRSSLDYIFEYEVAFDNIDRYRHLRVEVVTGEITQVVPEPDPDVLYLQHDDELDDTFTLCVNDGSGWMIVGETKDILKNYWSKEVSAEEIGMQIIPVLDDDTIKAKVDKAFRRVVK